MIIVFFAICHSVWGLVTVRMYLYVIRVNFSLVLNWEILVLFLPVWMWSWTVYNLSDAWQWIELNFINLFPSVLKMHIKQQSKMWCHLITGIGENSCGYYVKCKWFFITFSGCMYYFRNPDPFCALSLSLNKCINNLASHIGPLPI